MSGQDFWFTSGWHLLDRNSEGWMIPSEDFMAAYFTRPELALVEESCDAEIALHGKLSKSPFSLVDEAELEAIKDPDVAHNYRAVLRFRDFLSRHDTLEAAYLAAARGATVQFPPLFMEHMAHIILRNILDGETDPMKLRAAEILFRDQRVSIDDGRIMVADSTTVQLQADYQQAMDETPGDAARNVMIDIMTSETAGEYWQRHDLFNMSVDIAFTQPALDALCRVLEDWIAHFLRISTRVAPMVRIDDDNWRWHLGLDVDSTRILNDLFRGEEVEEDRLKQILCLFQLTSAEGFEAEYINTPVYMGLAMNPAGIVRAKPQNVLVNLPLAEKSS